MIEVTGDGAVVLAAAGIGWLLLIVAGLIADTIQRRKRER